jgi:hypothetical protein
MATPPSAFHLDVVGSTQDEARTRFSCLPVLVTAARQSSGRGRTGATWESAPRAVAASLAWEPGWPDAAVARLSLVAGLAAADTLGDAIGLKWPNDLMRGEAKVGGILTERFGPVVVAGSKETCSARPQCQGSMPMIESRGPAACRRWCPDPGRAAGPGVGMGEYPPAA